MSVDLGKHAVEVLLSYAGTIVLLGGIVWLSLVQYRRAAQALKQAEAQND